MEKINVKERKNQMFSVTLSVTAIMIAVTSAGIQLTSQKAEVVGETVKQLSEIIIAAIAGSIYLFHQIRNYIIKRREKKKEESVKVKSGIEFINAVDLSVKHAENNMFKEYNFLRSFVIHFSNGEFSDARLSLIKMTIKHEVVGNRTVKKLTDHYQGKPIPEMFDSMIRRVIFEGHYYIEDRESIKANLPLYQWMEIYDTSSMLCVEIRDSTSRKIVAILVMQWRIKNGINKEQIPQIKEDKKSIEDIYDRL
jgi:hypothetical protein